MSYISVQSGASRGIAVDYSASHPSVYDVSLIIPAYFHVELETESGGARLSLTVEDARVLLERLPRLVMEHDAAEHVRAEQVAAEKSAADKAA